MSTISESPDRIHSPDGHTSLLDGHVSSPDGQVAIQAPNDARRLLHTLEQLIRLEGTDLKAALNHASTLIVEATGSDKMDAFMFDPTVSTLVAIGVSDTPMAREQKRIGMDRLPLANGGRVVETFLTGKSYCTGRADLDQKVLPGFRIGLGIRSMVAVAFEVNGERRGVMHVASTTPDLFTESDVAFFEAAAHWLGAIAHRAELVEQIAGEAAEQARHLVADELVTTLAHDLRNYITPIKGHIDVIRHRATRQDRGADVRNADAALDGVTRLNTLVSDLLDVARFEQGIFEVLRAPVDLAALIEEAAIVFRGGDSALHLRLPEELVVEADGSRIRQALDNLMANAIKHSPKGVAVTVELEAETRDSGEWAVINIRDEGPGIDPQLLPRLFSKFGHGKGSTGLGLGLYLARGIAEAHGGTLTVESTPVKGTMFKMSLPVGNGKRGLSSRA